MLPIKFDFDWPSGFREEDLLNIMVIYMYNAIGAGADPPLGSQVYSES